jgi:hypothetical protein
MNFVYKTAQFAFFCTIVTQAFAGQISVTPPSGLSGSIIIASPSMPVAVAPPAPPTVPAVQSTVASPVSVVGSPAQIAVSSPQQAVPANTGAAKASLSNQARIQTVISSIDSVDIKGFTNTQIQKAIPIVKNILSSSKVELSEVQRAALNDHLNKLTNSLK